MLLPATGLLAAHTGPGTAMPGMSAAPAAGLPALAAVLALFMIGYIIWTTDRLAIHPHPARCPGMPRCLASASGLGRSAAGR